MDKCPGHRVSRFPSLRTGGPAGDQRFDKRLQPRTPEARLAKELTLPDPVKWGQY